MSRSNRSKQVYVKNPIISVLSEDEKKKISPEFRSIFDKAIQRKTIAEEVMFSHTFRVSDLVSMPSTGNAPIFDVGTFGFDSATTLSKKLQKVLDANTHAYVTDMHVINWYHDSPFFVELSCNKVLDGLCITEFLSGSKVNPDILKASPDKYPVLICPPIMYTSREPSNAIEDDIQQLALDESTFPDAPDNSTIIGGSNKNSNFISTYSFVTPNSVKATLLKNDSNNMIVTHMSSLVGLIARALGNVYPIVIPDNEFDAENTHYLSMDTGISQKCIELIGKNVEIAQKHGRMLLSDIKFGIKINNMAPRWRIDVDRDTGERRLIDTNTDIGNAHPISFNDNITVKFKVFINIMVLNKKVENTYAFDPLNKNVFLFWPWSKDALNPDGKPKPALDSKGKPITQMVKGGRRVPMFRTARQDIYAIFNRPQNTEQFIDPNPEFPELVHPELYAQQSESPFSPSSSYSQLQSSSSSSSYQSLSDD